MYSYQKWNFNLRGHSLMCSFDDDSIVSWIITATTEFTKQLHAFECGTFSIVIQKATRRDVISLKLFLKYWLKVSPENDKLFVAW